jgi:hypothetical protein
MNNMDDEKISKSIKKKVIFLVSKDDKLDVKAAFEEEDLSIKGYKVIRKVKQPSVYVMQKWLDNGVAKALDGCDTEPDGICEHGAPSWLVKLGLI